MQVTNEGYVLTRNVIRVNVKNNKFIKFIKTHKISVLVSIIFVGLVITELVLLNNFIKLLATL